MGGGGTGMQGGGHYGMVCATCHGPEGKGGVYLAMGAVKTPSIQYKVLTAPEEGYTDTLIKQAITKGLEPDGKNLNSFMPRWSMTDKDQADLLAFLKAL